MKKDEPADPDWVTRFGKERLPHPHFSFWQIVLEWQQVKDYFIQISERIAGDCLP